MPSLKNHPVGAFPGGPGSFSIRLFLGWALVLSTGAEAAPPSPTTAPNNVLRLTPQTVVDLTLSSGARAKSAEYQAQRSYLGLQKALGVFDFQFKLTPQYEYSESQTIDGRQNLLDRTATLNTSLAKKLRTGSTFSLDYLNVLSNSSLPATTTSRAANAALNSLQLTYRQNLWQNGFGYADRLAIEVGQAAIEAALQTRELTLQTVILDAMTLFWNTYIAERQLRENISARDKYSQLVKSTRQKAGFNLSAPGELPRLEAEMQLAEQRVKSSSAAYLNSVTALLSALQIESKDAVEISVPDDLPQVPQVRSVDVAILRPVQVAQLSRQNAWRSLEATKNQSRLKLDFVAKARSTGVEEDNGPSIAEMQSGSKPYYYVGVELEAPLNSELYRGQIADAEIALRQAEIDLKIQTDGARDQLASFERQIASQYSVAKSSMDVVDLRTRVVSQLEVAYRQGRQPLVELIRAYNELFTAQLDRAKAIGQYHIFLNQFAAARDELVVNMRR